jgi:hypothetical protein
MRKCLCAFGSLLAVTATLALSPAARADDYAYAVGTTNVEGVFLYRVDLTTLLPTEIGNVKYVMEGLALSRTTKTLYGTDLYGQLYIIDTKTGHTKILGSTGRGDIEALGFDGNTLIGVDLLNPPTIFAINTSDAQTTTIVTAATPTGAVRAMAVVDRYHVLVVADGPPLDTLFEIDLVTGAVTTIGTLAVDTDGQPQTGSSVPAINFVNGTLYGLDLNGNVWIIDPHDAAVTLVGNTGPQNYLDMTAIPTAGGSN